MIMHNRPLLATALLVAALACTVLVYWVGLDGPFVLDDQNNLAVIQQWLAGDASLRSVLFDGRSGMFGRPLAMGSMALGAWLGGFDPFAFKLGNLIVHLLCGIAAFGLIRNLAERDPHLSAIAQWAAVAVATMWLLHPLHASTVLYAVQRMAQLSTLFLMLGTWYYVHIRVRLEAGATPAKCVGLLVGIPLFLGAGFLSKENAILLPGLCLAVELAYFSTKPKPRVVKWFFALALFLPAVAGLITLARHPEIYLAGYSKRDFTLGERLLTEPRVLLDYLRLTLIPVPPQMGVFTDDFAPSTGLLTPLTTLASIVALAGISAIAWFTRRRIPALLAGWGIFLVGHALEGSIFALELYFEHRNYLPLLGILYALVGMIVAASHRLDSQGIRTGRIVIVLVSGVALLLAFGTHGRARVWSTKETLALSAISGHPLSARATAFLAGTALEHGNPTLASQAIDRLGTSPIPRAQATSHLLRLYFSCASRGDANPDDLLKGMALMPPRMAPSELELLTYLLNNTPDGCGTVTDPMIADEIAHFLTRMTDQSPRSSTRIHLEYLAGKFYLRGGKIQLARQHARAAWQPSADLSIAGLLVLTMVSEADFKAADEIYAEVSRRVDASSAQETAWLANLRMGIDVARAKDAQLQPHSGPTSPSNPE